MAQRLVLPQSSCFELGIGLFFSTAERDAFNEMKGIFDTDMRAITMMCVTHCEDMDNEQRREWIKEFFVENKEISQLLGKGVLCMGLKDWSKLKKPVLRADAEATYKQDAQTLRTELLKCTQTAPVKVEKVVTQVKKSSWCSIL
jgi:hypothetical protein